MPKKRGSLLIELSASLALLGIAALMLVKMFSTIAVQKRLLQQQTHASQTAANLLERELARPFAQIAASKDIAVITGEPSLQNNAQASLAVQPIPATATTPAAKRLTITIAWTSPHGIAESLQQTAWRYETQEGTP